MKTGTRVFDVLIEVVQFLYKRCFVEVDDVLHHTLGRMIGYRMCSIVRSGYERINKRNVGVLGICLRHSGKKGNSIYKRAMIKVGYETFEVCSLVQTRTPTGNMARCWFYDIGNNGED